MKIFYPAKVIIEEDGAYTIDMIDLKGCTTFGKNLNEAIEFAKDAIGLYLEDYIEEDYPKASIPNNINLEKNEFITLIEFDNIEYLKRNSNKAVKKTLSIPSWLNLKAEEKNINFSQVLQKALKKELNIDI